MAAPGPPATPSGGTAVPPTPRTAMRLMNSRPPPMIDPRLRDAQPGQVHLRDDDDNESTSPRSSPSPAGPTQPPQPQASLETFASSLALRKRRKTDHSTELIAAAKMTEQERSIVIFDKLLDLEARGKKEEAAAAQLFQLPSEVKTNSAQYTLALLLSGPIPAYMLNMEDILKVLVDNGVYPATWNDSLHRMRKLRKHLQTFATNKRCSLKDSIEASIKNGDCLDVLCQAMVGKSGIKVTPGFRARAAFLRFSFANNLEHQGGDFWEFVDEEMKTLRANANGTADGMQYFMNNFVREDAKIYTLGNDKSYTVITDDSELPGFQRTMSEAAAGFVPLV